MTHTYQGQIVWIVGASSGIGLALAHTLAKAGAHLALTARTHDRLNAVLTSLSGEGHSAFPFDVAESDGAARTADEIHKRYGRIDRVIFLAALYEPTSLYDLREETTRKLVEANLMGAFHLIRGLLPVLREQGYGQIALCGSVAGYVGLPNGQPYSATKAAIINLAESLRAEESSHGIDVRLISPGFVRTGLTAKNDFEMPFLITPEQAADAIAAGLCGKYFEIHFPKRFTFIMKLLRALPYALFFPLAEKMKRKNG